VSWMLWNYAISGYNCMQGSYVVGHERANSLLFQSIVSILWVLIVFSCGYLKCSILYKGNGLQLTVCACYLWEMTLNVGLDALFDNIYDWKAIREKKGEVNSTKACTVNDDTSRWILNRRYSSFLWRNVALTVLERSIWRIFKLTDFRASKIYMVWRDEHISHFSLGWVKIIHTIKHCDFVETFL
jgi:hypothetical protein